jgi:hypothetical protein
VVAERRRDERKMQKVVIHNLDSSVRMVIVLLLRQSDTGTSAMTWKDLREEKERDTANQAVPQIFKYLYSEEY